jgi:hypothetical protein
MVAESGQDNSELNPLIKNPAKILPENTPDNESLAKGKDS